MTPFYFFNFEEVREGAASEAIILFTQLLRSESLFQLELATLQESVFLFQNVNGKQLRGVRSICIPIFREVTADAGPRGSVPRGIRVDPRG